MPKIIENLKDRLLAEAMQQLEQGGYEAVTGTSFSTPFVSGSAALMMEWGILQGNDPYLYGEAVKANLQKGARQLLGITQWPNPELGYGVLDLKNSIPQ